MTRTNAMKPTAQMEASDPAHSAWVSANAGSGKTTVLVWRVIRLLLGGVKPARILCLTYTKAAAANMANRTLTTLRNWVQLDDEALDKELARFDPSLPSAERRKKAKRLFAEALETPGGLKVQTIHAFCDRVLHMFPVESRVPAGFEVLDDTGERDLLARARLDTLTAAGENPNGELGRALAYVIDNTSDDRLQDVLAEAVRARAALSPKLTSDDAIAAALGLKPEEVTAAIEAKIVNGNHLPRSEWNAIAHALQSLGGNAARTAKRLQDAARAPAVKTAEEYLRVFFKTDGEPRADKDFGAADARKKEPQLFARLFAEAERVVPLSAKLAAARERERSAALFRIATEVIGRYEAAKKARGMLDFSDLVTKTVALLEREESAWVHFKLDGGIEHILVDEAQDTSPEQWRIVGKLAEEFFAGAGASEKPRTIFAVGDEKQSIFSFQGADPARFGEMRVEFQTRISATGRKLLLPRLNDSYRSVPAVLGAVDRVYESEGTRAGVSGDKAVHVAIRNNAPGRVELWPCTAWDKTEDDATGWEAPLDTVRESSAQAKLADCIAKAVLHWTKSGGLSVGEYERSGGEETRRAVREGDIIVLVQKRGALFNTILRRLKQAGIKVAGADRLQLTEHIAVMDLMALGDALLLEEDDLQLACALKSPLFGFTDDDLFALAHKRQGSLMQSLRNSADPRHLAGVTKLDRWRREARHLKPFDFYSRVLGRDEGRKQMMSRLGEEAADAVDEFLSRAFGYETLETPSLQGFLGFLRRAGAEVKRDLESAGDAVRVMTVHGVKGLEAPVVILADTTSLPAAQFTPKLLRAGGDNGPFVWAAGKSADDSAVMANARDAAIRNRDEEYRRLLYVALTRAADVLVVCGSLDRRSKEAKPESWYGLVWNALESDKQHARRVKTDYHDEEVLRWRDASETLLEQQDAPAQPPFSVPEWLAPAGATVVSRKRRLRPSHLLEEELPGNALHPPRADRGAARGILVHRLLQSLPALAEAERRAAGRRYLASAAAHLDEAAREALLSESLGVIAHPLCAALFGTGSRAEAECIARIISESGTLEIPARIDRLLVTGERITLADFKSDLRIPENADAVPLRYRAQLAAYREALRAAFPGRAIQSLLIYTGGPRVIEVPESALDSAWDRVQTRGARAFS